MTAHSYSKHRTRFKATGGPLKSLGLAFADDLEDIGKTALVDAHYKGRSMMGATMVMLLYTLVLALMSWQEERSRYIWPALMQTTDEVYRIPNLSFLWYGCCGIAIASLFMLQWLHVFYHSWKHGAKSNVMSLNDIFDDVILLSSMAHLPATIAAAISIWYSHRDVHHVTFHGEPMFFAPIFLLTPMVFVAAAIIFRSIYRWRLSNRGMRG